MEKHPNFFKTSKMISVWAVDKTPLLHSIILVGQQRPLITFHNPHQAVDSLTSYITQTTKGISLPICAYRGVRQAATANTWIIHKYLSDLQAKHRQDQSGVSCPTKHAQSSQHTYRETSAENWPRCTCKPSCHGRWWMIRNFSASADLILTGLSAKF